ncbi:MAG: class I SAM-dependent methyltransferase [Deltaproteobacteria bacterium]|nr:class I SAM-dependent methyltransferase [Deltaproteobacteria bacterium]
MSYYGDKRAALCDLFGSDDVEVARAELRVGRRRYPIVDDVIVLTAPERWPRGLTERLDRAPAAGAGETPFAADVQRSFGAEWQSYPSLLPEHAEEFARYFDLIDLAGLRDRRLCDLGCGNGRFSFHAAPLCRQLVLVDFSDAIFAARRNLQPHRHCLFFLADLTELPFRDDCCDLLFCLGVLHHLPTPCLEAVRDLRRLAPELLIYLYYALDNRLPHFRWLLRGVTAARRRLCRIEDERFRRAFAAAGARLIYRPLVRLGQTLEPLGWQHQVPLYDGYRGQSVARIEQDVYDRFFTPIEQRVTRIEIASLRDAFSEVVIAPGGPYWHFLCRR